MSYDTKASYLTSLSQFLCKSNDNNQSHRIAVKIKRFSACKTLITVPDYLSVSNYLPLLGFRCQMVILTYTISCLPAPNPRIIFLMLKNKNNEYIVILQNNDPLCVSSYVNNSKRFLRD